MIPTNWISTRTWSLQAGNNAQMEGLISIHKYLWSSHKWLYCRKIVWNQEQRSSSVLIVWVVETLLTKSPVPSYLQFTIPVISRHCHCGAVDHLLQELHRVTFILPDNTHRYHLWPGHPTITTLHGWIFFLCTWSSVAIIFSGSVITGEGVKVLSTRWEVRRTKQLSSSSSQLKILPLDELNSILDQDL